MRKKQTVLEWLMETYFPDAPQRINALLDVLKQVDAAFEQIQLSINERTAALKGVIMRIASGYHEAWERAAPIILAMPEIVRFLREVEFPRVNQDAANHLRDAGFFAVPWMPWSMLTFASDPESPLEEITECVMQWMEPRIEDVVNGWSVLPDFEPAMDAISKAMAFHHQGEYLAAASILTPIPEGVTTRFILRTYGEQVAEKLRRWPGKKIRLILEDYAGESEAAQADVLAFLIIDSIEFAFVERFYGNTMDTPVKELMQKGKDYLNRHDYAHGYDLEYGTHKNAVRLFLLLELLSHVFEAISTKHD